MTTAATTVYLVPPEGGWTADDLDAFPGDGLRYELVDGVLLVGAAPSEEHQIALANLSLFLHGPASAHLRVFAPFDVRFSPRRQLQPDGVVAPRDRTAAGRRPLLVVEVLSPSTRATDSALERHVFGQGGVPSHWLVDPLEPSLTVLVLHDGRYVEVAAVRGDESYEAALPSPVRVVASRLLD